MADDAPSLVKDFAAATANLRDTTKWLIGGVLSVAVGVLAGSPLTNLGSLDFGLRLWSALAGAVLAFILLGWLLWLGLKVVVADSFGIDDLAIAQGDLAARARRMEARIGGRFPLSPPTFAGQMKGYDALAPDGDEAKKAKTALNGLKPEIGFEYKRTFFIDFRNAMFGLMPVVIASVAVFAWAANPPPEKPLSDTPHREPVTINATSLAGLGAKLSPACYPRDAKGRVTTPALVTRELPDGLEFITLPPAECPSVQLIQREGRTFLPD